MLGVALGVALMLALSSLAQVLAVALAVVRMLAVLGFLATQTRIPALGSSRSVGF